MEYYEINEIDKENNETVKKKTLYMF